MTPEEEQQEADRTVAKVKGYLVGVISTLVIMAFVVYGAQKNRKDFFGFKDPYE